MEGARAAARAKNAVEAKQAMQAMAARPGRPRVHARVLRYPWSGSGMVVVVRNGARFRCSVSKAELVREILKVKWLMFDEIKSSLAGAPLRLRAGSPTHPMVFAWWLSTKKFSYC